MRLQFDVIGDWTEIKLDIIREYAKAYSEIMTSKRLYHIYIDAFAGAGLHISKSTHDFVLGSPLNALNINPPFREFYFIDIDSAKTANLRKITSTREDIHILEGDCNSKLLKEVFPAIKYKDYRRGLCLLDPYGLHLNWEVIQTAGQMRTIDMFLNFPVADMNRNVLWRNPEGVGQADIQRMNDYWGDDSWRQIAYNTQGNLFGLEIKEDNDTIASSFQTRLRNIGGFQYVPNPLPMRNSKGATVYYLFFASQQSVALEIINYIFNKYSNRGIK